MHARPVAEEVAPPPGGPRYRAIAEAIVRRIRDGSLQEGERLPPSRELASTHGVNRATVHQAVQVLKAGGFVETNKGGGTRVACRSTAQPVVGPNPPWDRIASTLLSRVVAETAAAPALYAAEQGSVPYDLSRLAPDERDFPADAFAQLLAEVARNGTLLSYGSPFGYRPLRETLAERLRLRGIPADPDALLIVNGAQQGLDLVTRAFVDPGDGVAVEVPTYSGALALFRAHRARLLGVPQDADGPETAALEKVLSTGPKFLYTIPDFQNPTGALVPESRRREMARAAAASGTLVVEDAFDADLLVEGVLPPPLAALAPGHVAHLGTLSKALFPGVRVGWIAGPRELVHRLAALKRVGELTSPLVLQAAVNLFLVRGEYERHLGRTRTRLRARLETAHRAILESFPAGTSCARPAGGWVLWIRLPPEVSGRALAALCREKGVLVSPGADFVADGADVPAVRVSVSRGRAADLQAALGIAGAAARSLARAARRAARHSPHQPETAASREEALIQV